MTSEPVQIALNRLLEREGGFVNDPLDTGGPTRWGITARTLGEWLQMSGPAPLAMVESLPQSTARAIYLDRYVVRPGLDQLADADVLDAAIDSAVLFGPPRAVGWLAVIPDLADAIDRIGPDHPAAVQRLLLQTVSAAPREQLLSADAAQINAMPADRVVDLLGACGIVRHAKRVKEDPGQIRFLRGWLVRRLAFMVR